MLAAAARDGAADDIVVRRRLRELCGDRISAVLCEGLDGRVREKVGADVGRKRDGLGW